MQEMFLKNNIVSRTFIVYTIGIILLCTLPINSSESGLNNNYLVSIRFDYLAHFVLFIPWMFLLKKTSNFSFKKNINSTAGLILVALLFALSTELIQYYLPFRAFNINDLVANGIGIIIGSLFYIR